MFKRTTSFARIDSSKEKSAPKKKNSGGKKPKKDKLCQVNYPLLFIAKYSTLLYNSLLSNTHTGNLNKSSSHESNQSTHNFLWSYKLNSNIRYSCLVHYVPNLGIIVLTKLQVKLGSINLSRKLTLQINIEGSYAQLPQKNR